jgi:hypothetical protein
VDAQETKKAIGDQASAQGNRRGRALGRSILGTVILIALVRLLIAIVRGTGLADVFGGVILSIGIAFVLYLLLARYYK